MTPEQIAALCLALPGAREDIKWGGVRVFSVAGNKMFALLDLSGSDSLAFKVDDDLFLSYCDRPGFRPAPYLARAHWVSLSHPYQASAEELNSTAAPLAPTGGGAPAQVPPYRPSPRQRKPRSLTAPTIIFCT